MPLIIHCADLHLSESEKDYSFSVLEQIIQLTGEHKADYLIMAGDIFDSFDDLNNLRSDFRNCIKKTAADTKILYIPGNHENLNRGQTELDKFDFGQAVMLNKTPFTFIKENNIEFVAIPHQADYKEYREWNIPPKISGNTRIAVAHGNVSGMSFTGIDDETGAGVMDPDLFEYFNCDYVCLGHIHSRRSRSSGNTQIFYPGSARVWRRGEIGMRGVSLIRINNDIKTDFIPLKSAGQYFFYRIPVSFEGIPENIHSNIGSWTQADWVEIEFTGVIEDEKLLAVEVEKLNDQFKKSVRKIFFNRENVTVFSGIASHMAARRFIELWKQKEPTKDDPLKWDAWLKARELGLCEIKFLLEAKE